MIINGRYANSIYVGATQDPTFIPVVKSGLVLYWDAFGRANTDSNKYSFPDKSGLGNNGTLNAGYIFDATYGWKNNGLVQNQIAADNITIATTTGALAAINSTFTVEVIAKNVQTVNSHLMTTSTGFGTTKGFGIRSGSSAPYFRGYLYGASLTTIDHNTITPLSSAIHHFSFRRDGTKVVLSIDGLLYTAYVAAGIDVSNNYLQVGTSVQAGKTTYAVRIYNRILSDEEVEFNRQYDKQRYGF